MAFEKRAVFVSFPFNADLASLSVLPPPYPHPSIFHSPISFALTLSASVTGDLNAALLLLKQELSRAPAITMTNDAGA